MKKLLVLLLLIVASSCTENQRAKTWGGQLTINLPAGKKLINATWKESNLWYLYENADSNYSPKQIIFKEQSTYGINEGTIYFIESK